MERVDDEALLLTHAEYKLLLDNVDQHCRAFTQFLVMTGTRFGEATALTIADTTSDVLAPGDEEAFEISFAPLPATARFTDSAGSAWRRESSGLLTEIGADYNLLTP